MPPAEGCQRQQTGADRDHDLEGQMHDVRRWSFRFRRRIEPLDRGVRVELLNQRCQVRDLDREPLLAVDHDSSDGEGRAGRRLLQQLDGGELGGLRGGNVPGRQVPGEDLNGSSDGTDGEPDRHTHAVQSVTAAPQPAPRIDSGNHEAHDQVGCGQHVEELGRDRSIEDGGPRVDIDDLTGGRVDLEIEARWFVHPTVDGEHAERAEHPGDGDRDEGRHVHLGGKSLPPVEVDAEEDGLEEEEDAFEGEGESDHVAEGSHQAWPQQPHLEAEDGPGNSPHCEEDGGRLPPSVRQLERVGVAVAKAASVSEVDQGRKRDTEARQHDVESERQGHQPARSQQIAFCRSEDE